ncbi:hypothetical protein NP493_144g00014 [Ridgeia piscesae]|uniref:Uncharacterized protein n=1 Tax=Ridgeia piscesae TaxID=27915 RepID=A0AAD9P4M1_RIDPI|nr:hypothetical protein NP493_144g00014 [Ridgeia piscesae]
MARAQMNAYLVVVGLMVVHVQYSCGFGKGEYSSNCTMSSDCKFENSRCYKYNECKMGLCTCNFGYVYDNSKCKKVRKIGERCDVDNEACYGDHSSCKGICYCHRGYKASEDKKTCVGSKLGEPCYDYANTLWRSQECDVVTKGDPCDDHTPCGVYVAYAAFSYSCIKGKCSCIDNEKEFTYKYHGANGDNRTFAGCIHKDVKLGAATKAKCTITPLPYSSAGKEDILCDDFLTCGYCGESMNEWFNNTKICLSGSAVHLSLNLVVVFGLLVLLLLVKPNYIDSIVWYGAVRCGAVRCGAVRCGAVRCGAVRCGAVRCGAVRYGSAVHLSLNLAVAFGLLVLLLLVKPNWSAYFGINRTVTPYCRVFGFPVSRDIYKI